MAADTAINEDLTDWQGAAKDVVPANTPHDVDPVSVGTPTSLPANLRLLKGELRNHSVAPTWIRLLGLDDTSLAPSPDAPSVVDATHFSLPGDWTGTGVPWAVAGRRLRFLTGANNYLYGTVLDSTFTVNLTTVEVKIDSGDALGSVLEVQWSAHDPAHADSLPAIAVWDAGNQVFRSNPTLVPYIIDVQQGGTGNQTGQPSGAAGGDLQGSYPTPVVAKIQQIPVQVQVPTDQMVLTYDAGLSKAIWQLVAQYSFANTNAMPGSVRLGSLIVQWGQVAVTNPNFATGFDSSIALLAAFPTAILTAFAFLTSTDSAGAKWGFPRWDEGAALDTVNFHVSGFGNGVGVYHIVAIALGY